MTETKTRPNIENPEAWVSHAIPFLAWIFIMGLMGDPEGWKYALRSVLCLGIFIYCRPWRWYPRLNLKNIPAAIGIGIFVFVFWVFFETPWAIEQLPLLHGLYTKFGTMLLWKDYSLIKVPVITLAYGDLEILRHYAPEVCGWPMTIMRIAGSAFVISFIEEFFWRGWLYRWMLAENFLKVDLGKLDWKPFIYVCLFFGVMHQRWLAGFLCAIVYGLFVIKTKDVWAAGIAHMLTNFLLGLYVVLADQYLFWS